MIRVRAIVTVGVRVRVKVRVRITSMVLGFRVAELAITCVALSIVVEDMTPFTPALPMDVTLLIGADPNPNARQSLRSVLSPFMRLRPLSEI